jgi:hypothetical protein
MWDVARDSQQGKRKLRSPNIEAAHLVMKAGIDPQCKDRVGMISSDL